MEEQTNKKELTDNELSIVSKEYELLWSYYNRTIEERFKLFDWYFKIVTLPTSVLIGILTLTNPKPAQDSLHQINVISYYPLFGIIFLIILLCGVSLFITYLKQSVIASKYHNAIDAIRIFYKANFPAIEKAFEINLRIKHNSNYFDSIKFWRSAVFIWFNSFIAAFSIYVFCKYFNKSEWLSIALCITTFIIILILHFILIKRYSNIPEAPMIVNTERPPNPN